MKTKWILLSFIFFFISTLSFNVEAKESRKFLVILQAGMKASDGLARSLHALLYAQELHDHGYEVVLVFDGAGTQWVNDWNDPDSASKYKALYENLRDEGVTQVICDYCATAFQAKSNLAGEEEHLSAEYQGHPSIAKYVDQGYELVTL